MDLQPASEALMLLISRGCKTNCVTKRCSCMSQGLSCTDSCRYSDLFQNMNPIDFLSERDSESDDGRED